MTNNLSEVSFSAVKGVFMKAYIKRLLDNSKKWEVIFWWILRAVMLGALVDSIFFRKDVQQSLQTSANLVLMFLWEIFQMFPQKTFLRNIPSYIQDFLAPGLFLASFGGAYLNFYYSVPEYDLVFHAVGGLAGAFAGYEVVVAMQKRDKVQCSAAIAVLCAFGFSFFAGTGWELFEFTFDQIAGGDAQHWSLELAKEASAQYGVKLPNVIPALDDMRWALIDTMEDIICNTVGAVIAWIILKIKPYHHTGKNNVNLLFAPQTKAELKKQKAKAAK